MALATRCPHCQTTFKVAQDQLKLRAGLVRCGACKQIFNGVEHLLRQAEPTQSAAPAPAFASSPPADSKLPTAPVVSHSDMSAQLPASTDMRDDAQGVSMTAAEPARASEIKPEVVPPDRPAPSVDDTSDPLQRMTLMDFSHFDDDSQDENAEGVSGNTTTNYDADTPDPLDKAIEDLQRKPLRSGRRTSSPAASDEPEEEADTDEEPGFVKQARRRQRFGRALRIVMTVGSLILLITLLAQGIVAFRNDVAARFPQSRPALVQACQLLGCQVGLLSQIDSVSIESSELQVVAPERNVFAFTVLLRNRGTTPQAWPHIELVLNDPNEKPIARRVFAPRDYLPQSLEPKQGFSSTSEQTVRLLFELAELKASGYRVYLFYP